MLPWIWKIQVLWFMQLWILFLRLISWNQQKKKSENRWLQWNWWYENYFLKVKTELKWEGKGAASTHNRQEKLQKHLMREKIKAAQWFSSALNSVWSMLAGAARKIRDGEVEGWEKEVLSKLGDILDWRVSWYNLIVIKYVYIYAYRG